MTFTPEEARDKICCMPIARDPKYLIDPAQYCIADGCMAWRWNDQGSLREINRRPAEGKGYCGLAGRPSGAYA